MTTSTKKFNFGLTDYYGTKAHATITIAIENKEDKPVFTASGEITLYWHRQPVCSGQCIDKIADMYPENTIVQKIHDLWKRNHLNNMHAGTPEQEQALEKAGLTGFATEYEECVEYLTKCGLNPVVLPNGNEYKFGHSWLYQPISDEDMEEITQLLAA